MSRGHSVDTAVDAASRRTGGLVGSTLVLFSHELSPLPFGHFAG